MLGTFQKALVKKSKTLAASPAPSAISPVAESPQKKKKPAVKKPKKKPSSASQEPKKASVKKTKNLQKSKKKDGDEEDSSEEEEVVEAKTVEPMKPENVKSQHQSLVNSTIKKPLGQVESSKPDPKLAAQRILQSERPDLFAGNSDDINPDDIKLLDDFLLKKGELKGGVSLTLGKVVEMESKIEVGSGNEVEVLMLYAYGRFGSVYIAYKEPTEEQERKGIETFYALKTSRRSYATTRIQNEITILEHLWSPNKKNAAIPSHIAPLFFHGTAGGTPYFMMPILDVNLEKLRQEVGYKLPWADAFFIAQESLLGIKESHAHHIVHRDIKPTNLLLGGKSSQNFWLCDFGDACRIGGKRIVSPPDAQTLPFMSREAHRATKEMIPASVGWDVESWFYMVFDLFTALPWKLETEESETLANKQRFWSQLDQYFQVNGSILPPQLYQLAQLVTRAVDGHIYSRLTVILKDGFLKNSGDGGGGGWKPSWVDKRKKMGGMVFPNMTGRKKKAKMVKKNKESKDRKKK